jgi:hypothetical protein
VIIDPPPTVISERPQPTVVAQPQPTAIAQPRPSAGDAPTPAPAPPARPVSIVAVPFSVPPGETRPVPADTTCSGDVVVNGERWFDSDAGTALVVYFGQEAQVLGPWGFSCMPGDQRTDECGRKRTADGFRSCQPNDRFPR